MLYETLIVRDNKVLGICVNILSSVLIFFTVSYIPNLLNAT